MKEYGFVAEPHSHYWLISPAVKEDGNIICFDLSGFCGSWVMKLGGKFFPSPNNSSLCTIAMDQANNYAYEKNKGLLDEF